LEGLLKGEDSMTGADVGSKQKSWTRKHLIRPLLDEVRLGWEPAIHSGGEAYTNCGVPKLDILIIGEEKSINKFEEAEEQIKIAS
jgi:hypothetical protein